MLGRTSAAADRIGFDVALVAVEQAHQLIGIRKQDRQPRALLIGLAQRFQDSHVERQHRSAPEQGRCDLAARRVAPDTRPGDDAIDRAAEFGDRLVSAPRHRRKL